MKRIYTVLNRERWATWYDFYIVKLVLKRLQKLGYEYESKFGGEYETPWGGVVGDAELIFYDEDTDILKGFTFAEDWNSLGNIFNNRNNENDLLLATHHASFEGERDRMDKKYRIKPFIYGVHDVNFDYDKYYEKKRNIREFVDKMCLYEGMTRRHTIYCEGGYLSYPHIFEGGVLSLSREEYCDSIIKHKVGLDLSGAGEINHRTIEYMALSQPFIRLEFISNLDPPLIANYHYITVPREEYGFPKDHNLDRNGGEKYIKAHIDRFLEVKDDLDFLSFISKNSREYYENFISGNQIDRIFDMLEV